MLIDIHAHIWAGNLENSKRDMINAIESYNLSKVFVSGLGTLSPSEDEIDLLNHEVFKFMQEQPNLIGGFCYINPNHQKSTDVLMKGVEIQGMSGMKLWVSTLCDDPKVFPLIEKCIDYKIPTMIHTFHKAVGQLAYESVGSNVANLAARYPEAKLIMAHLGGNCYSQLKPIQHCKNVWVDFSGSLFRRDDLDYTKELLGADRMVFGTDMPGASFWVNYGQVLEADLTPGEKDLIFYQNALKLLDRH